MRAVAPTLPVLRLPDAVREHRLDVAVIGAIAALWIAAGMAVGEGPAYPAPDAGETAEEAEIRRAIAARPEPDQLKQIAPTDAVAVNASIPISGLPNPAARPFSLAAASAADRGRSIDCLAAAIYYEAATEPLEGQRAVAQVVLNRVRHPAYPSTVCGVVFEGAQRRTGCQFTFTCDGSLRRTPSASGWARARQIAEAALSGTVYAPVGWATHYHTNWVVPYWASSLTKAANVGTHIFYRWTGGWGLAAAFRGRHPGVEPAIAWRGGFGQPVGGEGEEGETESAEARDAAARQAAADAAVEAATGHSVDSFQRAVLRRYEPLSRDSANSRIAERTRADRSLTNSQRWALTGESEAATQQPLGRRAETAESPAEPASEAAR